MEGIRRALVLCLVPIAGTAIEQAPSVGPVLLFFSTTVVCMEGANSILVWGLIRITYWERQDISLVSHPSLLVSIHCSLCWYFSYHLCADLC